MFKKFCLCLLLWAGCADAYSPVRSVIVINAGTNDVIYSYNADQKIQPASLTKMMTLRLVFRALQARTITQNTAIFVSRHAADQSPTKLGLRAGSSIRLYDAILSLITKSANDMAVAIAEHVGGNEANFVKMMNQEARRLGMTSTFFVNPSGWKNTRQYTTARDMSKLSLSLIRDYPQYYKLFSTKVFNFGGKSLPNHNKLLGKLEISPGVYSVVDGIKTGYVAASGFNIAVSAVSGRMRLIAVVMGGRTAKHRDDHVRLLLEKGFPRAKRQMATNVIKRAKVGIVRADPTESSQAYIDQVYHDIPEPMHRRQKQIAQRVINKSDYSYKKINYKLQKKVHRLATAALRKKQKKEATKLVKSAIKSKKHKK